jgi:hypothetical protein
MDFSLYMESLSELMRSNPLLAVAAAIILLIAIYLRPKLFLGVLFFTLLVAGVLYAIFSLSSVGVSSKEKMLDRSVPRNSSYITKSMPWNF